MMANNMVNRISKPFIYTALSMDAMQDFMHVHVRDNILSYYILKANREWHNTHKGVNTTIRHTVVCRQPRKTRKPEKTGHRTRVCYLRKP